jgi:outer membrane protein assembly factor BamB
MFDTFMYSDKTGQRISLRWSQRLPSLVRVPIFSAVLSRGYVVSYRERTREYLLHCFDPDSGAIYWETNLINGGYGSPAISGNTVAVPTKFIDVTGVDATTGITTWNYRGNARVRSPIAVDSKSAFAFSYGSCLVRLSEAGQELSRFSAPEHFLFGIPRETEHGFISMATHTGKSGRSIICVLSFNHDGSLRWKRDLGQGHITSSDTSGPGHSAHGLLCCGRNSVHCLDPADGSEKWTFETRDTDIVGRQMPTAIHEHVLVPSVEGSVYCLHGSTGQLRWKFQGSTIANTPVSILGDLGLISVDGQTTLLNLKDGTPFDHIPTGHSPYSALTMYANKVYIGGGDPPYHGRLYCFDVVPRDQEQTFVCRIDNTIATDNSTHFYLHIELTNCSERVASATLDASAITENSTNGASREIPPVHSEGTRFTFDVPVRPTIVAGLYAVDLYFTTVSGTTISRTALVSIERNTPLPTRVLLSGITPVEQQSKFYSGSAAAQMVQRHHGQAVVPQEAIREMVDYVRARGNYEPFNVWRIVLRRVLSTSAQKVTDLPEYNIRDLKPDPDGVE